MAHRRQPVYGGQTFWNRRKLVTHLPNGNVDIVTPGLPALQLAHRISPVLPITRRDYRIATTAT